MESASLFVTSRTGGLEHPDSREVPSDVRRLHRSRRDGSKAASQASWPTI